MTDDLYRKEALQHRSRALFGDVILRGPISTWIITAILIVITVIILAGLFLIQVQTDAGVISVLDWIKAQGHA